MQRERLLNATLAAASRHGLARLSLEDVAREAGVSRQTLYRYFGSKDALIGAAVLREEERFIEAALVAAGRHADLRPAIEAAVATVLRLAREHPLLDRLLATEPEALLPVLTTGRGPVLAACKPVIERLFRDRLPHLSDPEINGLADACGRLLVSYAVNPPDEPVEVVAAGLADLIARGFDKD